MSKEPDEPSKEEFSLDEDDELKKRDKVEMAVRAYIKLRNVKLMFGGRFRVTNAEEFGVEAMAERMWHDCSYRFTQRQYAAALKKLYSEMINKLYQDVRKKIIEVPKPETEAALHQAVRAIISPNATEDQFEYYVQAIKQMIWQVKQKFMKRESKWDIFIVLYSKNGATGKSTWVHNFGRHLESYFMEDADFDLFMDKFRKGSLNKYYLAFIDEMQSADNRELRAIKNTVTKSKVQGRGMHSETEYMLDRNVSFIAASNKRITDDIQDESMRRWVEIECSETRIVEDQERLDSFNAVDWPSVWACVDVDDPSPYGEHLELFARHQAQLETVNTFDLVSSDLFEISDNCRLTNLEAYQAYQAAIGHHRISIQKFAADMKKKYEYVKHDNAIIYKNLKVKQSDKG